MSANPTPPLLEFERIGKSFVGVKVLHEISFALPQGQTLGLVGENGAGKSTLMNILGGNLRPDSGSMRLEGKVYAPDNPREAARHGIGFIHQELNLFPNLTIAENIFLTSFPRALPGLPIIDRKSVRARTARLLEQVQLPFPPDTLVERLSAGERQLVEIAKALSLDARLIIFDEPTTSLTSRETEHFFELVRKLQQRSISMIYISHALGDALKLCQQLLVLRDGRIAGAGPNEQFNIDRLISLMVGRQLTQLFPQRQSAPQPRKALEVLNLSQPGVVSNIHFDLRKGEILGISGLMGAGRSELARILFGLDPCKEGEILLEGKPLPPGARARIQQGLAFLTENRREEGLCPEASIADNMVMVAMPQFVRSPFKWLQFAKIRDAIHRMREAVRITPSARNEQPAKTLSGGNQQKVVLSKWLLKKPAVFILDEPTRGIDVGAKYEIYQLIQDLAAQGAGVLVISSEIEELIGLCDRILVMSHGEIRDSLERSEFDRERILKGALKSGRLPASTG